MGGHRHRSDSGGAALTPPTPVTRPAEFATAGAAAVAFLLGRAFGWDEAIQGAVTVLVGLVPAGMSWLVDTLRA